MRILEGIRTAALVLLAVAVAWVAIHGVDVHHDGYVNLTVGGGALPINVNVSH